MKKKMAGIIAVIGIIMCGVFCFVRQTDNAKAEDIKAEDVKAEDIDKEDDYSRCILKENPDPPITSSNPFDYVDKESYNNILAMGTDAINPLQEQIDSGELSAPCEYVCCALMQEVTQCYMLDAAGSSWGNVKTFKELWYATINSLPKTLENIQNNDSMSAEEKQAELEKYGVFGKVFAKKAVEADFEMGGEKISITNDKSVKAVYDNIGGEVSDKDVENVMEYLDYKCGQN